MGSLRRALIPAAGSGTRLDRPNTPKPLVDIGGVPLIVRVLSQLEQAGIEEAVVVVGYEAPVVTRALTHHPRLHLKVRIVENPSWRDGQAASVLAARHLLDGPFLLSMSDHVFDARLVEKMAAITPDPSGIVALVDTALDQVFDLEAAVKVTLDGDRVTDLGHLERYDGVDAGLFAAGPALLQALVDARAENGGASLADGVRRLARAGRVRAVKTDGLPWDDVDTPAAAVHAEMRLRRERRLAVARDSKQRPRQVSARSYEFVTGAPATTEVVVGRGLGTSSQTLDLGIPAESSSSPLFLLTDQTVNRLYGDRVMAGLEQGGYLVHRIVMPDGESAKTLQNFTWLVEDVLAKGIDERSILISLGGGVVNNVTGFAASTLYRGIGLIHVPTTLMAQCDAAISHKQALNGARGKNLIGSYYAPIRIVVDVDFLQTLDDRRLRDGLSEALKHALAQDPEYLEWFLRYDGSIRDPKFLEHVVRRNIELKCALMANDPKEHAEGMVLQYAHNIGHAVEYLSGYELTHGEAISIGMVAAARVARIMGGCSEDLVKTHEKVLARYGLPLRVPANIRVPDIIDAMRYDKRTHIEGVRMALLTDVGKLWQVDGDYVIPVPESVLVEALRATAEAR
jgi:3-dehydroquinate synthase